MVYVKDDLIINVDSSLVDNINNSLSNEEKKKALEKQLGGEKENVELVNFDYNEESGLTSTSFNFDGVNDYIKVKYDKEEEKQKFLNRGFTFEFYGIWNGGTTDPKYLAKNPNVNYNGLFCFWNGNESEQAEFRFRNVSSERRDVECNLAFEYL